MARDGSWLALRAAILSGFPSVATPSFFECPVSVPVPFARRHDRRARRMPLAREDISHISDLMNSTPPPGPDVIPNFNF